MLRNLIANFILYLIIINAAGMALMLADKHAAERRARRVPEKVLLNIAYFGGCFGIFFGMLLFRHKTRHARFSIGVPLVMAAYFLGLSALAIYLRSLPSGML